MNVPLSPLGKIALQNLIQRQRQELEDLVFVLRVNDRQENQLLDIAKMEWLKEEQG